MDKTIDKIVRTTLGFVGTATEIPRLVIKYGLGLCWTGYTAIRGKDFKVVFSKLNSGMANEIKWVLDEFKFYT
jgi:hypothetical protein